MTIDYLIKYCFQLIFHWLLLPLAVVWFSHETFWFSCYFCHPCTVTSHTNFLPSVLVFRFILVTIHLSHWPRIAFHAKNNWAFKGKTRVFFPTSSVSLQASSHTWVNQCLCCKHQRGKSGTDLPSGCSNCDCHLDCGVLPFLCKSCEFVPWDRSML